MASIAKMTRGTLEGESEPSISIYAISDEDGGFNLPAPLAEAAKADPDDAENRPDAMDALHYAFALGHAWGLARAESPFASRDEIAGVAKDQALRALLDHYGVEEVED